MREKGNLPPEARSPLGAGRAGAVVAIDWGRKRHVAVAGNGDIIRFKDMQELVKRVPSPALIFIEASTPYPELCRLYEACREIYLVDTKLVTQYRKLNNISKSHVNDAKVLLEVAKDFISGRLSKGVWQFVPDALGRACDEAERTFRAYQKLQTLLPERANEFKREYGRLKREALELARRSEDFRRVVKALGFGEDSVELASGVAELRGRRYSGRRALLADGGFDALRAPKAPGKPCPATGGKCTSKCKHGKYNRRLKRMASSLAYTAIIRRVEPWYGVYKEVKERLLAHGFSRGHADRAARVRLAAKILVAVAEAVGALP